MDRITIIGMGPIGTSMGLALKRGTATFEVMGTCGDREALAKASKMGAVDQTSGNLRSALRGAKMVIIDTPMNEMREMMEAIGPILEEGCVVTDTASTKTRVLGWADECLPKTVSFVGGHPLSKKQLTSQDDADATLFDSIQYAVIPAASAAEWSVRSVVDLVERLGATPVFLDATEHDSYAAAMTFLPIILSTAYVNTAAGSEGWREMHRLAASEFSEASALASNDPIDNEIACLTNPDDLVHWLDRTIMELYSLRNKINDRSEDLLDSFVTAFEARARWEAGMVIPADEKPALPTVGDAMAAVFMGDRMREQFRKIRDSDRKTDDWRYTKKR